MELAFEAAFVVGFAVVAGSFVAVILGRASPRALVALTGVLAVAALACAGALAVNLVEDFAETAPLVLAAAGLAAAATAEAGLVALRRGLRHVREDERVLTAGRNRIAAALDEHAAERAEELERTLARERANANHLLGQQERRLALERRDLIARQADSARAELAKSIEQVQERLEQRLTAWAADLDRGQSALETRLNQLAQRQAEAIRAYEARLAADSDHLQTVTDEQQAAVGRLRAELHQVGHEILQEGRAEVESHTAERQRALHDLATRSREQERELREHLEREHTEALARLTSSFEDAERRQREALERSLERTGGRLVEEAERRFDAQIRQSREKSAARLSNELEKAMEQFARRAEKEVSERIGEAAQSAAARLERRIAEMTRAAEAQHEVAAERLRLITERLDDALRDADERIAAVEAQIETEVTVKLEALERSIKAAEL